MKCDYLLFYYINILLYVIFLIRTIFLTIIIYLNKYFCKTGPLGSTSMILILINGAWE